MRTPLIIAIVAIVAAGSFALGRFTVPPPPVEEPPDPTSEWVRTGFKHIDMGTLTPDQRAIVVNVLNTEDDICGCEDQTVADALIDITICEEGRRLANKVVTLASEGNSLEAIRIEVDNLVRPRYEIPINNAPTRGPKDAPITMVEYSCFSCGFSRKVQDTLTILDQKYPGKIQHVFKFFPLGYQSDNPAYALGAQLARAGLAAKDHGKFWEFHDATFDKYMEFKRAANDTEKLNAQFTEIANTIGVPPESLIAGSTSEIYDEMVASDVQEGQAAGVRGTPYFLFNGRGLSGAQPYCSFRKIIEEEIEATESRTQQNAGSGQIIPG